MSPKPIVASVVRLKHAEDKGADADVADQWSRQEHDDDRDDEDGMTTRGELRARA